jgi:amino acid adenylation domain-containing protein
VYHEQYTFEIDDALDPTTFEQAWAHVFSRHASLRVAFVWEDVERPLQTVLRDAPMSWEHQDWSADDGPRHRTRLANWLTRDRARGFDVRRAPLARALLARLGPDRWRFVWSYHHLLSDGWSLPLIRSEVFSAYAAMRQGQAPSLPPPAQFRAYLEWLERRDPKASETFWRTLLRGCRPSVLALRAPSVPLADHDTHGRLDTAIDAGTMDAVRAFARRERLTLNTVLLGAWCLLISHYAGVDDVVTGVTYSGRTPEIPDVDTIVGTFLNTLPLRCRISDTGDLGEWLRDLQNRQVKIRAHEHSPLRHVQNWTSVAPSTPMFDHVFVMESHRIVPNSDETGGLSIRDVQYHARSNFSLALIAEPTDRLNLYLVYMRDRIGAHDVAQMAEHYRQIVEGIVNRPHRAPAEVGPTSALSVLNRRDEHSHDHEEVWLHRFRQQVETSPDTTAIVSQGQVLSYAELDRRARSLAGRLRRAGVSPRSRIALLADRTPASVAAMLAAWYARAAYVPLNPEDPIDRLHGLIAQVDASAVVGTLDHLVRLDLAPSRPTVDLDPGADLDAPDDTPLTLPEPDDTAYVMFTSGSTGRPRGVVVTHANLSFSNGARDEVYDRAPTGFLLLSPPWFDSSVAGLFWTLGTGGTVCLPAATELLEPASLRALVRRHAVSHLLAIPALYRELIAAPDAGDDLAALDTVIVAGEACPTALPRTHFSRLPGCALFNEYGPTEATVWCTVHRFEPSERPAAVTIGRPIPGMGVVLRNAHGQAVPAGVPGELWTFGPGVAHGYLSDDELTAERFSAVAGEPGRGYRTGDRARLLPDGTLEYLGRLDHQVKLRGHRIETAEVEAVVSADPSVRDVSVVLQSPAPTDVDVLVSQLSALDEGEAERLLDSLESPSPDETAPSAGDTLRERHQAFDVTLRVHDAGFVRPPRDDQRRWLLDRALRELTEDLEHLDGVSARMVPGVAQADTDLDRSQGELTADQIMEDWQTPLMAAMADIVTAQRGDVLEIGFGRGVSAEMIQAGQPRSHTIIEVNEAGIRNFFEPWKRKHPDADIRLVHGRWQDVRAQLGRYDGLFFHAVPLDEREFFDRMVDDVTFAAHFFADAAALLRSGGVFTYLTTEIDSLSRRHQRTLLAHFGSFEARVVPLTVPRDTRDAWWADSMVVVRAVKA